MKQILKFFTNYKKETVLAPLFKLLEAVFELFVPLVVANILDKGIPTGDKSYVGRMFAMLVILTVIADFAHFAKIRNIKNNKDLRNATSEYLGRTVVDNANFVCKDVVKDLNTVRGKKYYSKNLTKARAKRNKNRRKNYYI